MKQKIIILIMTLFLSTNAIMTINCDLNVEATSGGGDNGYLDIDWNYIYNVSDELSKVIFVAYDDTDIQKGRAFGTKGEHYAKDRIVYRMNELDLYNVTTEQIKDHPNIGIDDKLEILDRELKINGTENITDFFITPFWNGSIVNKIDWWPKLFKYDMDKLTHTFNYTNLKVYREPDPTWWYDIINNETIIDLMQNNESITNISTFLTFIMPFIENKYGFKFDELNETNAPDKIPWYNDTYAPLCSSPYVFIKETNAFNPSATPPLYKNLTPPWSKLLSWIGQTKFILQKGFWKLSNCKGKILYDFNNNTYDMAHGNYQPIPTIQINNTIGIPIYEDPSNYTISFKIKQNWNTAVESYNVIGQINGTDQDKTVILCSLYDSWWNQGTADSAIGVGIVLGLAKYMKELEAMNITPKYNVKIILFGGEEYGYLGAKSYASKHIGENIIAVIDINQIGYNQTDPRQTLNIITNKTYMKYLTEEIGGRTDYVERMDDTTDFETWYRPSSGPSNDEPFTDYYDCITMCFIKGYGSNKNWRWKLHHRDGENHSKGDTMDYYDENDVNLTAEMVWNVTKTLAYDPDVWFDGTPTFTNDDTNDDGYDDTINVSYTIDTSWPCEHISVRLVLYPRFQWKHPGFPIFYRLREEKEYVIDQDGISDYITITIPDNYPKGNYRAELYLCNSTGDAILDAVHLIGIKTFIDGWELINRMKDVSLDFLNELLPLKEGIYKFLGIDVVDWVKRLPDLRDKRVRDILIDILGFYKYRNDSYCTSFYLHPPNRHPDTPEQPIDLEIGIINNWYKTKTTDPDPDDRIKYQWNWNGINGTWSFWTYAQNKYHFKPHLWLISGEKTIKVRAKNPGNPNVFSNWSNVTNVTINPGCYFDIVTSQTNQDNNINPYVRNSFDPTLVVVGENVLFQGYSMGYQETPEYDYNFSGLPINEVQSVERNFSSVGLNYVNFTSTLGGNISYYNLTINVVNISACFNCIPLAAHPNQIILFNDTTIGNQNLTNWTWNFGDGNTSYEQNTSHNYSQTGVYNISLTVKDNNNENHTFWQIMHVETNPPEIIIATHYPEPGILGNNITIYADFYDNNESGISNASVNISYPDETTNNYTMYTNENTSYDYEYLFNDTMQVGWYYYTVWATDLANNTNSSSGYGFQIKPAFGNSIPGNMSKNIKNSISGSNFTILVNGTADFITALIHSNLSTAPKTKCMIYRANDSELIGTTEEKILNTGDEADWVTYNFTTPKPNLAINTPYILTCWSNDTCNLSYYNASDNSFGRYKNAFYGTPPQNITTASCESRIYSIYCTYSTTPEILSVTASPDTIGYGYSTTITANVEHYYALVENITVNITRPDDNSNNYTMTSIDDDTFQYTFSDTWSLGQYNYSIWMQDKLGTNCSSTGHSFNVSINATIAICTINDSYGNNETVNLTDPPPESPSIGYELLDDDEVLHIWNKFDSYYFDTDNGIQLTNHYNKYWSHNVLMLGYYNNDQWNLIYRSDNLSGFNRNITTDNNTFVNATLWKDLSYQGYDFRLAIRYYLGVDDNELTVIPYIKNIDDENIPYTLGFAWEINDIQVDMTYSGDYIEINGTSYDLDETLDLTFTNMTIPVYCLDNITNESYVCDYTAIPYFYIREDMSETTGESLYLRWNETLDYRLQVKSKAGEYNAPVTLGIKIGTLNVGQEKHTSIYWYDAAEITYYFDNYYPGEMWASYPGDMVDGSTSNYASTTTSNDIELCDNNTCNGSYLGIISKAEIRSYGYWSGDLRDIILRPVFKDGDGDNHYFTPPRDNGDWSPWYDITSDNNAPATWQWSDVKNLDCDVESTGMFGTVYCSKVELRVTYTPNNYPTPSNSYPANGSIGISLQPVLNITVTDTDGDNMNITWLSNSSGSWQVFGTNNSVGNGTYHQTMSNASVNGQWWYWKVNASDGTNYTISDVFSFYTGYESKVVNWDSSHFKGYLLMQVQYYNTTNSTWVVVDDTVNETSPRIFKWDSPGGSPGQHIFALDTVFNGLVNTGNLSGYGNGTYRVYVCVRDPYGNALNAGGGIFGSGANYLETSYEFTITFD